MESIELMKNNSSDIKISHYIFFAHSKTGGDMSFSPGWADDKQKKETVCQLARLLKCKCTIHTCNASATAILILTSKRPW